MPNLETKWEREEFTDNQARLSVRIMIDGMDCGRVVVASGPKADVEDLIAGDITMQELSERWSPRPRKRRL